MLAKLRLVILMGNLILHIFSDEHAQQYSISELHPANYFQVKIIYLPTPTFALLLLYSETHLLLLLLLMAAFAAVVVPHSLLILKRIIDVKSCHTKETMANEKNYII
jgi:hypothetical protein